MTMPKRSCVGVIAILAVAGLFASGCDLAKSGQDKKSSEAAPPSRGMPPPMPPPPTNHPAVWRPESALLAQLQPYQDVKGYRVRPPNTWTHEPPVDSSAAKRVLYEWRGPKRPDGSRPELVVSWIAMPPSQKELSQGMHWLFDDLAATFVSGDDETSNGKGSVTNKEVGDIKDVRFVRGRITKPGEKAESVRSDFYVGRDGDTVILMRLTDASSHFEEIKKLGTAALFTLQKKP